MESRVRTLTALLLSALAVFAAPRTLWDYLARRDYQPAAAYYRMQLEKNQADVSAAKDLARVFDHQHMYDSSVTWWQRALELRPADDSAIIGRWNALYHRDKDDSAALVVTKQLILDEVAPFLAETTERSLSLAFDGLSLADSVKGAEVAALMTRLFPDSPRGYELIGSAFYDSLYPVWTNDSAKVLLIRRFLDRYPRSEWRQTFYIFLLSSLFGLKDTAQARAVAAEMTADDSLDPFRFRYAAAIFNRLNFAPEAAETYARRAIALEPLARKPKNKPQEQWEIDYPPLYGLARLALAEALKAQGGLDEARNWLDDAIRQFQWDPQQEATPGPFHCLLGEIQEAQGDTMDALGSYVRALQAGDSRNTWTMRADSGLKRLLPVSDGTAIEFGRKQLAYAGATFTDITDSAGLAGRRESRVAWGDYNNDGFDDLLLSGCILFRNDSGRSFTNVTDSVGLADVQGRGGVWADYDNDGWLDFWMSASAGLDRLYKNDAGRFRDVTKEAGMPADSWPTEGAAWADFDNDGWVDLYCANYENWEQHSYYPDKLWRNVQGQLYDWTDSGGIKLPHGTDLAGRGVSWADYDDDGYQDCYVSNYRLCENFLWHNNGQGRFENVAGREGVSGDEVNGWYGHTIGAEWADYDNDGDLDLFTADLAHPRYIEFSNRSRLYQNQGPKVYPRFTDRRAEAGIRYEETHSDPAWADVDNDGDLDLYVTSIYEGRRSFLYENQLITRNPKPNVQTPGFFEVTWLSGTRCYNGWGCAFSDF
ncbi:MAG: FG-GAP-like repeat-containing protein, partial [candidate division WOR-3 bacterium]